VPCTDQKRHAMSHCPRSVVLLLACLVGACAHKTPDRISTVQPAVMPSPQAAPALRASSMDEYRLLAARRIRDANPAATFRGPLPNPLASIPVLEIHLLADGRVRQIEVLRTPRHSPETVELAKQAVMNAQPFGVLSHLPQPWAISETFLYNDDLRFQLRTLVETEGQQ
jgi:hypothetical protein